MRMYPRLLTTKGGPATIPIVSANVDPRMLIHAMKENWDNIDFTKPISSGPNELGFDYFFGISASLDMHPHVYIENNRATEPPTAITPGSKGAALLPPGGEIQSRESITFADITAKFSGVLSACASIS